MSSDIVGIDVLSLFDTSKLRQFSACFI